MINNNSDFSISVLMPTYNRADFIEEALNSICPHLLPQDELVIVDDGSTDQTEAVVTPFLSDPRFKYVKKKHGIIAEARNKALEASSNPWIFWLDSDDLVEPGTMGIYRNYARRWSDVDVFYCNLRILHTQNGGIVNLKYEDYYKRNLQLVADLLHSNRIPQGGSLVKRRVYKKYGNYDTSMQRREDYEFWIRVARHVVFKKIPRYLYLWRWHRQNRDFDRLDQGKIYSALLLDRMLAQTPLEELFPTLDWRRRIHAQAIAHLKIGAGYLKWLNLDKAVQYFLKSLQYRENNDALFYLMISLYQLPHDKRQSTFSTIPKELLQKGWKLMKNRKGQTPVDRYRVASFNQQQGQLTLAKRKFNELLLNIDKKSGLDGIKSGTLFHLGEIALVENHTRNAEAFFKKCLEINPDHRKAKENITKYEK